MKKLILAMALIGASVAAHAEVIGFINTQPDGQQLFTDETCDAAATRMPNSLAAPFLRGRTDLLVWQTDAQGQTTAYGCYHRSGMLAVITWRDAATSVAPVAWSTF